MASSHIFATTGIVRIFATVFSENRASVRVLEKCGYYREAVQRKALFKYGKLMDAHIYALVRDEGVGGGYQKEERSGG